METKSISESIYSFQLGADQSGITFQETGATAVGRQGVNMDSIRYSSLVATPFDTTDIPEPDLEVMGTFHEWCQHCREVTLHDAIDLEDGMLTVCQSPDHAVPEL